LLNSWGIGTGYCPGWFKIVFEIFEIIFLPIPVSLRVRGQVPDSFRLGVSGTCPSDPFFLVVQTPPFSEKIYLLCPRSISSIAEKYIFSGK